MITSNKAPATGLNKDKTVVFDKLANAMIIRFNYDVNLIFQVKLLNGRRWEAEQKCWSAPVTVHNIDQLKKLGFTIDNELKKWHDVHTNIKKSLPTVDLGVLNTALDKYQIEGVQLIEVFDGRALIADDPGLGKTAQILAWLRIHPELRPVVIVTKATGKLVWDRQARVGILSAHSDEWIPLLPYDKIQIINGEEYTEMIGDVIILNYDILTNKRITVQGDFCSLYTEQEINVELPAKKKPKDIPCVSVPLPYSGHVDWLIDLKAPVTVLDEPQMISNRNAQRSIDTISLAKKSRYVLSASASPGKSRPREFFNILHLTRPDIFPNFYRYGMRYCNGTHNGFGYDFNGSSNLEELNKILTDSLMIRRRTEEVLGKLPLNRQVVPLQVTGRLQYDAAEKDFLGWLWKKGDYDRYTRADRAEVITQMSALFKLSSLAKTGMVIEWAKDFLETGTKLIMFTQHTRLLNKIIDAFPKKSVKLDGSCSPKQRQEAQDAFQNDPLIKLFVGNSDAAGDTITLTASYDTAFAELPRTSEDVKQNEGRSYARKNDPHGINSYFLVMADSIEEKRAMQLNVKARVMSQILDGKTLDEGDDLIKLLYTMRG